MLLFFLGGVTIISLNGSRIDIESQTIMDPLICATAQLGHSGTDPFHARLSDQPLRLARVLRLLSSLPASGHAPAKPASNVLVGLHGSGVPRLFQRMTEVRKLPAPSSASIQVQAEDQGLPQKRPTFSSLGHASHCFPSPAKVSKVWAFMKDKEQNQLHDASSK